MISNVAGTPAIADHFDLSVVLDAELDSSREAGAVAPRRQLAAALTEP
jgi:hypothetical protein